MSVHDCVSVNHCDNFFRHVVMIRADIFVQKIENFRIYFMTLTDAIVSTYVQP